MLAPATTVAPSMMGRYEIVATLAAGGMAEILLARLEGAEGFERPVVVKRILPQLARTRSYRDMFVDEARIAAAIRHPNVIDVHELIEHEGELFIVMEYLDGESVGSLMRRMWSRGRTLPRDMAAYIVAEACAGLHAAHELTDRDGHPRNLVHRDVSPHNVFVTYQGSIKLLDFGVAQASERITKTETGQVKGKFEYMSPEQCQSRPLDRRADVFALGVMLYELTTSRRLFKRPSLPATLDAICRQQVVSPSQVDPAYPAALEKVCLRALARRPSDRHATALEMRRELLAAVGSSADQARLPEERLGALMREVFADRFADKREMVRRCSSGAKVTEVPDAEVDAEIEIPIVEDGGTLLGSVAQDSTERARPRAGWIVALLAVAAVGAGLWLARQNAAPAIAGSDVQPAAATAMAVVPPPEPPPPVPATAAAPPSEVSLEIVTNPPGAEILIDGRASGRSPASITLPRGKSPVTLEVRRSGFVTARQTVAPDIDQRVVLDLRPSRGRPATAPRAKDPLGGHEVFE
jgi:serine/threonine-protein kinase